LNEENKVDSQCAFKVKAEYDWSAIASWH